jgi:glycosyltransferase involved in cell wall biosynthesis
MSEAPLILHVFPSFAVGGAQVRFAALANRHGARWRHAVMALDGETGCAARLDPRLDLQLLAPPPRARRLPRRLFAIHRLLRRQRPALLVTSNWGSIEWAMARLALPHLPHIHLEDGFGPEERATQLPRRVLTRRLALRFSRVVLPSLTLRRIAQETWRLPPARIHVIPNGVDLTRFHPAEGRAVLDLGGSGPILGTAAALRPEKNIGRLLRALALLRDGGDAARLIILGDGPERPRLEALAGQLGLGPCVRFLGHVAEPAAAYRAMDLFCLSSDTEQMPFAVLEAMASGLPVVSTDVGDVARMLPPESRAQVVAPEDAALAAALRPLLRDMALRQRLGAANRAHAERHYDQEQMFAAHAALIEEAIRR